MIMSHVMQAERELRLTMIMSHVMQAERELRLVMIRLVM